MADKYTIYKDAEHPGRWQVVEMANAEHQIAANLTSLEAQALAAKLNGRG